jgi:hypothetical protein
VEVDGVFSRCEIVQLQLKRDSRALIPDEDAAHVLPLGVFYFDFGFGGAS